MVLADISLALAILAVFLSLYDHSDFAILLFSLAFVVSYTAIPDNQEMELLEKSKQQIEQCEKELPRNQGCELKAVPKI